MTNFYWPVYKNLEQELISLSNTVHIDDKQTSVYSVKIAELLLRCVVEIESISKDLYFRHGGNHQKEDVHLYFDTDCMNFLESKWLLSKKKVVVSSANFYFQKNENKELFPLAKANKRGSSSADWAKAYQAVKHNRVANIGRANIKNLIRALAALYILNIYYRDEEFSLTSNSDKDFLSSWSTLFNINIHPFFGFAGNGEYLKRESFDESIYFTNAEENIKQLFAFTEEWLKIICDKTQQHPKIVNHRQKLEKNGVHIQDTELSSLVNSEWKNLLDHKKDYLPICAQAQREAIQKTGFDWTNLKPKFKAILNKNQLP